jgi:hypothetical protein
MTLAWLVSGSAQAQPPAVQGGTPTGQHPPAVEAEVDRLVHASIEAIYRSQITEAARIQQQVQQIAPSDPRVHLLEARILREKFPDQSTNGEHLQIVARPLHAALERAIACSDSLVARDKNSAAGYLYRGWAHLFRAQMHTLCDEYWSAGRQAKAGKTDLDRALELSPGNPDGEGIVGTYLYFADILPGVVKVARTVARVPGGDRRRGLELLRASAAGHGYNQLDARVLLGAIQFAFEGDYESGKATFEAFLHDYPNNPRLLEPLSVLELMRPERGNRERLATTVRMYAGSPEDYYRELSYRLTFYQALHEILEGEAADALTSLESVRKARPRNPDWFLGDVHLCLAETQLLGGDAAAAAALHAGAAHEPFEERLRFATDAGAAATAAEAAAFRGAQEAAHALYGGDLTTARQRLAALPAEDPAATFYRGELARIEGDARRAEGEFQRITAAALAARWRFYKTLAFQRLADIQGASGHPDVAAETLGKALAFDADRDLLRHFIRARRRFWELTRDGEFRAAPEGASAARNSGS